MIPGWGTKIPQAARGVAKKKKKTEGLKIYHHMANSPSLLVTCDMAVFVLAGLIHWFNKVEELELTQVFKITRSLGFLSRTA